MRCVVGLDVGSSLFVNPMAALLCRHLDQSCSAASHPRFRFWL